MHKNVARCNINCIIVMIISVVRLSYSYNSIGATKARVLQQAQTVRKILPVNCNKLPPNSSQLYYKSYYQRKNGPRGFCNWLIPDVVMIGQYPGMTPEDASSSKDDAKEHITRMVNEANIRVFCSLQDEIPPQDDFVTWTLFGCNYRGFSHYGNIAKEALKDSKDRITFLHSPIIDLSTPDSSSLYSLLSTILNEIESERNVYIHCWGGRGRAGTVGAILLGIIYPELEARLCLEWVQRGYDTRDGADTMAFELQKSPQTSQQREYVQRIIQDFRE